MAALVGGVGDYLIAPKLRQSPTAGREPSQGRLEQGVWAWFDREGFVAGALPPDRPFMRTLLETQMFATFIQLRVEAGWSQRDHSMGASLRRLRVEATNDDAQVRCGERVQ